MNDAADTPLNSLANSAGTALWNIDRPNIVSTGAGDLRFTQGDNLYSGATLTATNVTSGLYELGVKYSAATLAGGDATGATVGFGMRDDAGFDLFLVRILRQNGTLLLQTRIGTSNITYHDFGATLLPDTLTIRAVADLDADRMDLYYAVGSDPETRVADIAITDGEMDQLRLAAVLNAVDFGATDFIDIDYVTLRSLNWISADGLYDEWTALYPALGSFTNLTDNPDGDGLDNLAEYALGGDPANGADAGYAPDFQTLETGGTNYFEYVYARRTDAADRGLVYALERSTNLVSNVWTNGNVDVVGTGVLDPQFDSVTNRVPVEGEDQGFIRLRIEYQ
jgi:hypothetical protein